MRALFLWIYFLIVGGFLGAFFLMEYLGADFYSKEFRQAYSGYADRISDLIISDLEQSDDSQQVIAYWKRVVGSELSVLRLLPLPEHQYDAAERLTVVEVKITDLADEIRLQIKIPEAQFQHTVLEFVFIDAYSDNFESWYQKGVFAIFVFMAVLIAILVFILYRYLQGIQSLTSSVIDGDLTARVMPSRIPLFNDLSANINQMALALENGHKESQIFLGAIHHELRSPITKLRLALDIALSNKDNSLRDELLIDMDTDLEELNILMEDILMLSRLKLQEGASGEEELNLLFLLQELREAASDERITIADSDIILLSCNKVLITRALSNILTNALKFAEQKVLIEISRSEKFIEIAISDDGPGIPETDKQLIFKPFYRVDKGRARTTGGVGLGLAIASLVIAKMSGDIQVDSSIFGGARFRIRIPYL